MRKTTHALTVPVVLLLAAGIAACGGEVPVATTPGATNPPAQETPTTNATDKPGAGATDTPTTGATDTPGTGGGHREWGLISVSELQVGDCFNNIEADPNMAPTVVPLASCDGSHSNEVFNKVQIDDSKYSTVPTDDEMLAEMRSACLDAFESYVGIDLDSSSYLVRTYKPSSETWKNGDRTIICLIDSQPGSPLFGSARGTRK